MIPQTSINSITVSILKYDELIDEIRKSIERKDKLTVGYLNSHTFNLTYKYKNFKNDLKQFNIIHHDGIGIYLAFKFLKKDNVNLNRFTGSDFYTYLEQFLINNSIKTYFFGNTEKTLKIIKEKIKNINITGYHNGYEFNSNEIIEEINKSKTEVLIVGLGSPLQENWIIKNKNNIHSNIIIAVGEGIKMFSRTKIRGPKFIRTIGLEWFIRFLANPIKYFSRYFIGIPLFLFRVVGLKFTGK